MKIQDVRQNPQMSMIYVAIAVSTVVKICLKSFDYEVKNELLILFFH